MSAELKNFQSTSLKFILITDTHLLNQSAEVFHSINTRKSFERVLFQSLAEYPDADFLLLTGDISQTGDAESYQLFKSVIEKINIPVYCVPGNHDTPQHLQTLISSCPGDSINTIQFGDYALVLISSWVEDMHHGAISQNSLLQLEDYLTNCGAQFIIFAVHHPPIPVGSEWLDMLGLQNRGEFLQIINNYSGKSVMLFGHIHQELDIQQQRVRLLATPSTCYQFEKNTETMTIVRTQSPAYRFIKLHNYNIIDTVVHYVE